VTSSGSGNPGAVSGVCHRRTESNYEPLTCEEDSGYVALGLGTADCVGSHFWLPAPGGDWRPGRSSFRFAIFEL
jgi:hypothetical protein